MRILLLHQYFLEDDEGGGSRWNELAKIWAEEGHEITVLAGMIHANSKAKRAEYKGFYFKKKRQGKVNVWRCHISEAYNASFVGRLWGYFSFMFSSLWAGIFKIIGEFDVLIVTSPPLFVGFSGYLISKYQRLPMVFEVRDLWPESAIDTGVLTNSFLIKFAYWFEAFIYRKASLINVLTPVFKQKLVEIKKVPEDKVIMIPNAADFSLSDSVILHFDRDQFRREHLLEGKFVIIYVGAHGVANHLEQLLEAASLLSDTPVLFLLIGQGMEKEKLVAMAEKMKLSNVRFLDPVPKQEIFKFILASEAGTSVLKRIETFKTVYSNKTFDYMSCKKPILMAIDGASRELVEAANAGTYVEPENPKEYAEAVREYLKNPGRLLQEGENGYQYAKSHFDRQELSKDYLSKIRNLVHHHKP